MKTFLINLDKDTVKLAALDRQLKSLGIIYERVPGIYGKGLSEKARRAAFRPFRWWCAVGRPIAPAEIGCALSHYGIYKRMLDEKIPCAFIFEDDVIVAPDFNEVLKAIEGWIDKDKPQVILFSNHGNIDFSRRSPVCKFDGGVSLYGTHSGTCAESYCLTHAAAKALLWQNHPMITPCDNWGRWVKNRTIELYHAFPTTCSQNQVEFGSSTSMGRVSVAGLSSVRYVLHKFKRAMGKTIDMGLQMITKR